MKDKIKEINSMIAEKSSLVRKSNSIIEGEEVEIMESEYLSVKEIFQILNANSLVKEMKKESKLLEEALSEDLTSSLIKKVKMEALKDKERVVKEIDELKEKKEELIKYCVENQKYKQDYVIGFGKPKNKNGALYSKKEYSSLIKKVYDKLDIEGFDVLFDEVTNKIYLKEEDLSKTKVIDYIYDIIKDFEVVKKKFGGLRFKGLILILPVNFVEFYKNEKEL